LGEYESEMIIFPAIDLKDGCCVRLMQGDPERVTLYGRDPAAMARRWEQDGAEWLHVVDLDGAFSQSPKNRSAIEAIVRSIRIPVQVGGGIRHVETIGDYLQLGVQRVILGTVAFRQSELVEEACRQFPGRIALGVDARDGRVAVEGWQETTSTSVLSLIERLAHLDLAAVIYTDIHRDGMETGVNVEATRRLLEACPWPVIASGGVATLADINALVPLVPHGLEGVIIGRALYNGSILLPDALELVKKHQRGA
jgi:phosphoribosylformimino-5-aminoimidazole carboxamide ribotide isomerase